MMIIIATFLSCWQMLLLLPFYFVFIYKIFNVALSKILQCNTMCIIDTMFSSCYWLFSMQQL